MSKMFHFPAMGLLVALGMFASTPLCGQPAEGGDAGAQVDAWLKNLPPFIAEWASITQWNPDEAMADHDREQRDKVVESYGYPKGSEAEKALIASLEKQEAEIRQGRVENQRLYVKFYTYDRFLTELRDSRFDKPVKTVYSPGGGVVYEVNEVNKTVRIKPFDRNILSNLVWTVPHFVVKTTPADQVFVAVSHGDSTMDILSKLPDGSDRGKITVASMDTSRNLFTELKIVSRARNPKEPGAWREDPVLEFDLSGGRELAGSDQTIPEEVVRRFYFNPYNHITSRRRLIRLKKVSEDDREPEYRFTKGYRVYDMTVSPTRSFSSDEMLESD